MMPCAALLALLTIFIGVNLMQVQARKHLLVECEDNSEQMPKKEVEAVKRPSHGLTKDT